ncbi:MAG TPA: GGDEF domain-containing protein [Vicinamibacterales bacterium]|nr:GGDEF domain-containing protein [Vicinamibacterales bacterium]
MRSWCRAALVVALVIGTHAVLAAQAGSGRPLPADPLPSIPVASPVMILPRVFSAYGALVAAAMLSLLYLYRGRAFIVYWIGSWLLVAAALGLTARLYVDTTLRNVLIGVALLFTVWAAGLMRLAVESFPQHALRWDSRRLNVISAAALWFLVAPFIVRLSTVVATGTFAAAALLAWAAAGYIRLARHARSAGALLMGAGLTIIATGHVLGTAVSFAIDIGSWQGRLSGITVITALFVAFGMHLLVFEDMTDELRLTNRRLAGANEEVRRLAITDPLTGCHNRRFFDEIEKRETERHRRYGSPLSVAFIDVNHFKRLNDTLGHDRGDAVLRTIGTLLRAQVRQSDYAIRWGGDEFLLLLACGEEEATTKANQLKTAFDRERAAAELPIYLGLSIGVAAVPLTGGTLREAIREADSQMYGDKLSESGV